MVGLQVDLADRPSNSTTGSEGCPCMLDMLGFRGMVSCGFDPARLGGTEVAVSFRDNAIEMFSISVLESNVRMHMCFAR